MRIERLWAQSFRNLKSLAVVAEAPTIVLRGNNAQGKTNVLEAIYLCATGRSFRAGAVRELLAHGQTRARAQAVFARSEVRHEVTLDWAPTAANVVRQRLRMDGRALRQLSALLQLLNVVAFFPEDLSIAKGSPERRRRFFDRAVAGGRASFVQASAAYQRALKTRNALLRAPSAPTKALLAPYDAQLVRFGSAVWAARRAALAEVAPLARVAFRDLMPNHQLRLALVGGIAELDQHAQREGTAPEGCDADETGYAEAFWRALAQGYPRDRARGATHAGPHRGDLACYVDGHDVRTYASQGQQRAVVLALKLAELASNRQRLGSPPILLLDDVSSELDAERTASLFATVARLGCQTWVTTTGAVPLPIRTERQLFDVAGGELVARPPGN